MFSESYQSASHFYPVEMANFSVDSSTAVVPFSENCLLATCGKLYFRNGVKIHQSMIQHHVRDRS